MIDGSLNMLPNPSLINFGGNAFTSSFQLPEARRRLFCVCSQIGVPVHRQEKLAQQEQRCVSGVVGVVTVSIDKARSGDRELCETSVVNSAQSGDARRRSSSGTSGVRMGRR